MTTQVDSSTSTTSSSSTSKVIPLKDFKINMIESKINKDFRCYTWIIWICVFQASTSILTSAISRFPDIMGLAILLAIESVNGFASLFAAWAKIKFDTRKQNYAIIAWMLKMSLVIAFCAYTIFAMEKVEKGSGVLSYENASKLGSFLQKNMRLFIVFLYLPLNLGIIIWLLWNALKLKHLMSERNQLRNEALKNPNHASTVFVVITNQEN